ncbi:MAG: metal ABC transporter permease [bacterium]|nr:metal ABC transporter permease [bacterium]
MTFVQGMFAHEFMRTAFWVGTAVALSAGPVGYFLVLRGQVFSADALGHAAFTGALAALAFGANELVGLLVATIGVALALSLPRVRRRAGSDVLIGSVFAWLLGLGVLFLAIYTTYRSTANGSAGTTVLFGSIFGLGPEQVPLATALGLAVIVGMLVIGRPLLFASVDPEVAAARGIPVRALGAAFLVLLALTVGEATQAVGALLILGLLATPAAIAQRLTRGPGAGIALTAAVALTGLWAGLVLSYAAPRLPPSFAIIGLLFLGYVLTVAVTWLGRRARS